MADHNDSQQQAIPTEMGEDSNEVVALENEHPTVPPLQSHPSNIAADLDDAEISGDEATQLAALATGVRDQDDLERDIGRQADQLLFEQADERDRKRLEKTQKELDRLTSSIRVIERKLGEFGNNVTKTKLRAEHEHYTAMLGPLEKDLQQIRKRMEERQREANGEGEDKLEDAGNKQMPGESRREFLIRTGKITPFSKVGMHLLKQSSSLGDVLLDAEEGEEEDEEEEGVEERAQEEANGAGPVSHRNLLAPGFEQAASSPAEDDINGESDAALARRLQDEEFASERPAKRRRLQTRGARRATSEGASTNAEDSDAAFVPGEAAARDEEEDGEIDEDEVMPTTAGIKRKSRKSQKAVQSSEAEDLAGIDDGNEQVYQARLKSWVSRRSAARRQHTNQRPSNGDGDAEEEDEDAPPSHGTPEWQMPHPTREDAVFEGAFKIPGDIYPSLFDYQKTGVQWLWELYAQQVGGIIGDEMGLGKTIQIISFLAGLHYSGKLKKPIIVVCPATVMKQWVNEFHRWWPPLRVSILHTSGSGMLDLGRESRIEDDLEDDGYVRKSTQTKGHKSAKRILDRVIRDGHVLVTTYSGLQTYAELLIPTDWEYAVLDEGHKIRNPNTAITIYCKELRTHNRVILSGTPMQNNLTELWSLFDFVFPMRLGTLVSFKSSFEVPIKQGGYANANNLQVETAQKCAETLKDSISPYLLQRFKVDVAADLPKKSERVLFCKLTKLQRDNYEAFLRSEEMTSIMNGKRQALYGIDLLRKICNHPDLVDHKTLSKKTAYSYGAGNKSGKMQVVKALLEIWKRNGHKTLLFAQHRIMLDILEIFIKGLKGFNYRRMDGNTSIKDRQTLVDEFNNDPNLHVFLLTTKVGGLGVNLTGADRVIIYDPDWNPSTDVQARERAWRLGQKREVEIYRLMTAGTIEEKIYHRQIFKQFLTNKILRDPGQRQTFQLKDLHDLFSLGDAGDGPTETGSLFKGTEVKLRKEESTQSLPTPPEEQEKAADRAAVSGIFGIAHQADFQTGDEEPPAETEPGTNNSDRVLAGIFARTGVQSAQDHDAIINGKRAVRADPGMIAREAKRIAAEAARSLRDAEGVARTLPAGVPTWTGVHGRAGRSPSPPPRRGGRGGAASRGRGGAGPSSSAVLANLHNRQNGTITASGVGRAERQPKGREWITMIRDYLRAQGGEAYTQMLIDHFNRFCGTAQRTEEFKAMLKSIAELKTPGGRGRGGGQGNRGRGKWVLREEFR